MRRAHGSWGKGGTWDQWHLWNKIRDFSFPVWTSKYKEEQTSFGHFWQKSGRKVHTDVSDSFPGDLKEIPSPDVFLLGLELEKVEKERQ